MYFLLFFPVFACTEPRSSIPTPSESVSHQHDRTSLAPQFLCVPRAKAGRQSPLTLLDSSLPQNSRNPFPQPLCLPHLQNPFASVANKRLTTLDTAPQSPCFQHFPAIAISVTNTRLITPLESALTGEDVSKPFGCHTYKTGGWGLPGSSNFQL